MRNGSKRRTDIGGAARRGCVAAIATVLAIVLAACGDSDNSSQEAGSTKPSGGRLTPVTLSILPIIPNAALELGNEKGFFREQQLDLTLKMTEGPALVPSVLNGRSAGAQFTWGSLAVVRQSGVPVVGIANLATGGGALVSLGPLKDKHPTVAVGTLGGVAELQARAGLELLGIDPDDAKMVQIDFAQHAAALRSGRVDAADMPEPYITVLKQQEGANKVTLNRIPTELTQIMIMASEKLVTKDPELIGRLQRGINKSVEYAADHPDELVALLPKFVHIDKKVATELDLPTFDPAIDQASIQKTADLFYENHMLKKQVDMSKAVVASPATDDGK